MSGISSDQMGWPRTKSRARKKMREVATGRSLAPNEWFPSAQPHPARRATAPHLVRARSASRSPLVGRIAVPSQVGADVFAKRPISPGDQLAGDLGQRLVARGPGRRCSFVFSAASRASAGLARGSAPSTPNRPVNRRIRLLRDRRGVVGYPSDTLRYAEARREEAPVRTTSLLLEAGGLALFLNGALVDRCFSSVVPCRSSPPQPIARYVPATP